VEAATDIAVNCERQLEDFPIRQEQLPPGVTQPLHGSEWQGLWRRFLHLLRRQKGRFVYRTTVGGGVGGT